jgi:hypothetical protein
VGITSNAVLGATGTSDPSGGLTLNTLLGGQQTPFLHGNGVNGTGPGVSQDLHGHSGMAQLFAEVQNMLGGQSELTGIGGLANLLRGNGAHQGAVAQDTTNLGVGTVAGLESSSKPDPNTLLPPKH